MSDTDRTEELKRLQTAYVFLNDPYKRNELRKVILNRFEMGEKIDFLTETQRIEKNAERLSIARVS